MRPVWQSPWLSPRAAMVGLARSVQRPESRRVAFQQAFQQIAEDDGLEAMEQACSEIVDPQERAVTMLGVIEKYLTPPKPAKR